MPGRCEQSVHNLHVALVADAELMRCRPLQSFTLCARVDVQYKLLVASDYLQLAGAFTALYVHCAHRVAVHGVQQLGWQRVVCFSE